MMVSNKESPFPGGRYFQGQTVSFREAMLNFGGGEIKKRRKAPNPHRLDGFPPIYHLMIEEKSLVDSPVDFG